MTGRGVGRQSAPSPAPEGKKEPGLGRVILSFFSKFVICD